MNNHILIEVLITRPANAIDITVITKIVYTIGIDRLIFRINIVLFNAINTLPLGIINFDF